MPLRTPTWSGNRTQLFQSHRWLANPNEGRVSSLTCHSAQSLGFSWLNNYSQNVQATVCNLRFTWAKPRCLILTNMTSRWVQFTSQLGLTHYVTSNPKACVEFYNGKQSCFLLLRVTLLKMGFTDVKFHGELVLSLSCFPFQDHLIEVLILSHTSHSFTTRTTMMPLNPQFFSFYRRPPSSDLFSLHTWHVIKRLETLGLRAKGFCGVHLYHL